MPRESESIFFKKHCQTVLKKRWDVCLAFKHLIQLGATHFQNCGTGSGVQVWSGWRTLWCFWHTKSDAEIGVRYTLRFSPPGLEDILSSLLSNRPLHFFVYICQHCSSFFSVGFFSLEWFVYPQFPWVISAVIITVVENKHTHSVSSAHKRTHTNRPNEKQLPWA